MVTLKPSPWLYRNTHIKFIKKRDNSQNLYKITIKQRRNIHINILKHKLYPNKAIKQLNV